MDYFITGCAGFIGSEFVSQLLTKNNVHKVIGFDSLTYAGKLQNMNNFMNDSRFTFIKGDIVNYHQLESYVPDNCTIINFAAESHVDRSIENPSIFLDTNVIGVGNLLQISVKKQVAKFVQISTDEVLGSIEKGSWKSLDPLLPNSPYSASKASAELLVRAYAKTFGIEYLITRSSNNYGPRQGTEKLIPKLITSLLINSPLTIYGDGTNIREWIYVTDNVKMIINLIERGASGIWNVPGGHEKSNLEIVEMLKKLIPESTSKIISVRDRPAHDLRYSMDPSEYLNEFGDLETTNLEEGLLNTINWYREFGNDW